MSPEKWLLLWFLGLISAGTLVLMLPAMTASGGIPLIDAAFTAATSVCVTGLMVINIEHDMTAAGRVVILVLIQCGGVGIVTFASLLILSAQRRLPLDYQEIVSSTVSPARMGSLPDVVRAVVIATFGIEAVGALLLFVLWPDSGPGGFQAWPDRLWAAVFHAVSAFCNAGIGVFASSLEAFRADPGINLVIIALIVLGGIGFINLYELAWRLRQGRMRWSRFSVSLKVVLVLTPGLSLTGAVVLFLLERDVAFAGLDGPTRALAALFQSVTTRTAGFTSVSIASFSEVSLVLMMVLMFIGAGSGSCAGGIKVGTLAILFATLRGYLRNDAEPVLFNRRLSRFDQRKAVVLTVASVLIFHLALIVLFLVEVGPRPFADAHAEVLAVGFEVMSALGPVGLSTGLTPDLSTAGKAIIIALMIIGRLGPLAVISAWARRPTPRPFTNPEEPLPVG